MIGTLISAILMTRTGRLIDRFGVRIVAVIASFFLGLLLISFSRIDYTIAFLGNLFGINDSYRTYLNFVLVILSFLGIRFFGQGVLTLASRTMVMRWFEQRRGRIAAWFGMATAASFSLAPRFLQELINHSDWRGAWRIMALFLLAFAVPLIFIFFRDSPEHCGLKMEAGLRPMKAQKSRNQVTLKESTLQQARRDSRYWAYNLLLAWWGLFATAFTFHVVDIFHFQNVSVNQALSIFIPITVVSIVVNFIASWSSDFIKLPPFYFAMSIASVLVGLCMFLPNYSWSRMILILGYGTASGLWGMLNSIVWPRLYGRLHLGEISGSVLTFSVAGSAIGPWLFSQFRDNDDGYLGAGIFAIGTSLLLLLFGVLAFAIRRRVKNNLSLENSPSGD